MVDTHLPKNQAAGLCWLCIPVGMDCSVLQSVSLELYGGVGFGMVSAAVN